LLLFVLLGALVGGPLSRLVGSLCSARLFLGVLRIHQVGLLADGQCLDGDRQNALLRRSADLGSRGKTRTNVRWRISERGDNFEVLGFLAAGRRLRSGQSRRTDDRAIADIG